MTILEGFFKDFRKLRAKNLGRTAQLLTPAEASVEPALDALVLCLIRLESDQNGENTPVVKAEIARRSELIHGSLAMESARRKLRFRLGGPHG